MLGDLRGPGLHAVSKYALAADDAAAKTEQKHCTVATGNGAGGVEEAIECAHGTAEGAAADGDGAAYGAVYARRQGASPRSPKVCVSPSRLSVR